MSKDIPSERANARIPALREAIRDFGASEEGRRTLRDVCYAAGLFVVLLGVDLAGTHLSANGLLIVSVGVVLVGFAAWAVNLLQLKFRRAITALLLVGVYLDVSPHVIRAWNELGHHKDGQLSFVWCVGLGALLLTICRPRAERVVVVERRVAKLEMDAELDAIRGTGPSES